MYVDNFIFVFTCLFRLIVVLTVLFSFLRHFYAIYNHSKLNRFFKF